MTLRRLSGAPSGPIRVRRLAAGSMGSALGAWTSRSRRFPLQVKRAARWNAQIFGQVRQGFLFFAGKDAVLQESAGDFAVAQVAAVSRSKPRRRSSHGDGLLGKLVGRALQRSDAEDEQTRRRDAAVLALELVAEELLGSLAGNEEHGHEDCGNGRLADAPANLDVQA